MDEWETAEAAAADAVNAAEEEKAVPETELPEAGAETEENEELERLRRDAAAFAEKYPDVDVLRLEQQSDFRRFCGSRLYREPLGELYGDYLLFRQETEERSRQRSGDRMQRSTGSGSGQGSSGLSRSETRALEEWNNAFPYMKMTAGEFRSR